VHNTCRQPQKGKNNGSAGSFHFEVAGSLATVMYYIFFLEILGILSNLAEW
jgi:hypothetical protein